MKTFEELFLEARSNVIEINLILFKYFLLTLFCGGESL